MLKTKNYYIPFMLALPMSVAAYQNESNVECSDDVTLKYGQNIVCEIDDELDKDRFTFNVVEGELIYITTTKLGGGYRQVTEIYNPSGILIDGSEVSSLARASAYITFKAVESGTFSIVVSDRAAGQFRLQLDSTSNALNDSAINYGSSLNNIIDYAHDRDYYSVEMTAGTKVAFILRKSNALDRPTMRVFNTNNIELEKTRLSSLHGATGTIEMDVYQSGTYYIEVSDGAEGIYELAAECLLGGCPSSEGQHPSLEYLTGYIEGLKTDPDFNDGVEYAIKYPVDAGVDMPSVNPDLSITLPLATFGDQELKAELRYTENLTWELDSYSFIKE